MREFGRASAHRLQLHLRLRQHRESVMNGAVSAPPPVAPNIVGLRVKPLHRKPLTFRPRIAVDGDLVAPAHEAAARRVKKVGVSTGEISFHHRRRYLLKTESPVAWKLPRLASSSPCVSSKDRPSKNSLKSWASNPRTS